eukprot:1074115_1
MADKHADNELKLWLAKYRIGQIENSLVAQDITSLDDIGNCLASMDVLDLERWVAKRGWKRATANKFTKAVKLFNNISNDSEQTTASRPSQPTTASRPSQPKTSSHDDVKKEDDPELKLWFKQTLKLPQYHSSFIAYGIEKVEHLKLNVTDQDLIDMGIRAPMHRSRILKAIEDILDEEPDEMKLWFKNMKLQRYYQWFIDAGYGHLSSLNESVQDADLQKLGIKQERHRIKILKAIKEKEQRQKEEKRRKEAEQKRLEEQRRKEEEQKRESHHDDAEYNNRIDLNKAVTRVDNGVAMFFGVAKYISKLYKDLGDIDDDERHFRNTFAKEYGYRFVSNAYKNRTWTRDQALAWIQSMRDEILLKNGRIQYNGLIFCGASHGSMHSIICSDGTTLEVARIRSFFASSVKIQFKYLPKIFIFNCCRTPYAKEARGPAESTGAAGYGMTITGSEGN